MNSNKKRVVGAVFVGALLSMGNVMADETQNQTQTSQTPTTQTQENTSQSTQTDQQSTDQGNRSDIAKQRRQGDITGQEARQMRRQDRTSRREGRQSARQGESTANITTQDGATTSTSSNSSLGY